MSLILSRETNWIWGTFPALHFATKHQITINSRGKWLLVLFYLGHIWGRRHTTESHPVGTPFELWGTSLWRLGRRCSQKVLFISSTILCTLLREWHSGNWVTGHSCAFLLRVKECTGVPCNSIFILLYKKKTIKNTFKSRSIHTKIAEKPIHITEWKALLNKRIFSLFL